MEKKKKVTIWTRGFTLVLIANLFMSMSQFAVNTYVSTYMDFLGATATITGLIAGIYYGVAFVMRPISGPAITVLNKKTLMILVYSVGAVVYYGYAIFPTVGLFLVMRMIHGIQLAFYGSLALTVASNSLPKEKLASGLGIYGLSFISSQAFGPMFAVFSQNLGEQLFHNARGGFTGIFLMAAIMATIASIPCFFLPKEEKITKEQRVSMGVWYKNIVAKEALMPSAVAMLMGMGMILFNVYMIPYGMWKNIDNISLYFTVSAFVMLISRPLSGKLTDKYGSAKVFFPAACLYIVSFFAISYATDMKLIIVGAVCAALGMGSSGPAVQVMIIQSVPQYRRGVASNTNFLAMDLGGFIGPSIAGVVLTHFDYPILFRFAPIAVIAAIILFALGWKTHQKNCTIAERCDAKMDSQSSAEEIMSETIG